MSRANTIRGDDTLQSVLWSSSTNFQKVLSRSNAVRDLLPNKRRAFGQAPKRTAGVLNSGRAFFARWSRCGLHPFLDRPSFEQPHRATIGTLDVQIQRQAEL